jgi:AcrR family transcriptional regulator
MSDSETFPSNLTRSERRKQQTHEAIKTATLELLLTHGYGEITVSAITQKADIGHGTFYLHFADKDEAIWTVFREYTVSKDQQAADLLEGMEHGEKEYYLIRRYFKRAKPRLWLLRSLFGPNGSPALYQRYIDLMVDIYEQNTLNGIYTPGDTNVSLDFMANYYIGAILRLVLWWSEDESRYTPEEMAHMFYESYYRQPPPV